MRDREENARGRQETAEVTGGLGCLVLIRMWSEGDVQLLALTLRSHCSSASSWDWSRRLLGGAGRKEQSLSGSFLAELS